MTTENVTDTNEHRMAYYKLALVTQDIVDQGLWTTVCGEGSNCKAATREITPGHVCLLSKRTHWEDGKAPIPVCRHIGCISPFLAMGLLTTLENRDAPRFIPRTLRSALIPRLEGYDEYMRTNADKTAFDTMLHELWDTPGSANATYGHTTTTALWTQRFDARVWTPNAQGQLEPMSPG